MRTATRSGTLPCAEAAEELGVCEETGADVAAPISKTNAVAVSADTGTLLQRFNWMRASTVHVIRPWLQAPLLFDQWSADGRAVPDRNGFLVTSGAHEVQLRCWGRASRGQRHDDHHRWPGHLRCFPHARRPVGEAPPILPVIRFATLVQVYRATGRPRLDPRRVAARECPLRRRGVPTRAAGPVSHAGGEGAKPAVY